ncbi:Cytochrome c biogenesis protein CcsA [Candidatus Entotheonellaceae bacterium PAL068K]
MNSIFFHSVLLAYLFASLGFWLFLGLRQPGLLVVAHGLLGGGFSLQTVFLGLRLLSQTGGFWGDISASMGLLAWAIVVVYLFVWWRYRIEALGAFIVPLAFLATAYAGVLVTTPVGLPLAFQHLWLVVHIFLAILGYAMLALTFCTGLMYLIQEHQLKSKHPGTLYHRLPSLTLLRELNTRALLLGFPLLTQGLVTGSIWAKYVSGSYLHWNPKSIPLLLAWALYAVLLGGHYTLGWQGKKAASAAVVGFLVVLASYFVHTS